MAVDIFLKLENIDGESKDEQGHSAEIELESWSWGMSQSATTHHGPGGGAGKVNVQDISITKYVDKSSPLLKQFCSTGDHIKKGKLTVRKAAGTTPIEYITIDMEEIVIAHVSDGGSSGADRLTESISLNFAKYKYTYTPQKDDGSPDTPVFWAWNIPGHAEG